MAHRTQGNTLLNYYQFIIKDIIYYYKYRIIEYNIEYNRIYKFYILYYYKGYK